MIKVEAFTDYSSAPYTLNLDDFALAIVKQPYIQGSKCRAVELHHTDRIYVSTKLLGIDNAQPGDIVTRYLCSNAIFDIKCDDTWEFRVAELRYSYKPKWWQFWKKRKVDGYIVQVIRKDEENVYIN